MGRVLSEEQKGRGRREGREGGRECKGGRKGGRKCKGGKEIEVKGR